MTHEQKLQNYTNWITTRMAKGRQFVDFAGWMQLVTRASRLRKTFSVHRYSEVLQSTVTFNIRAVDRDQAYLKSTDLLHKLEVKHSVEIGANGKVLTEAEQKEKMIRDIEAAQARAQRSAERAEKKRQELIKQLKALTS